MNIFFFLAWLDADDADDVMYLKFIYFIVIFICVVEWAALMLSLGKLFVP